MLVLDPYTAPAATPEAPSPTVTPAQVRDSALRGKLRIEEILVKNAAVNPDEDGDFSDWIELHNVSDEPLALEGFRIADREGREGWAFPALRLPAEGPQILILHTHGSEAYTQAGLDRYEANDSYRTADTRCNIVRVGDELTALLEKAGLRVLHDREIYDFPSYTGSYTRSGAAVEKYLAQYPDIAVVIDMHRDALGSEGVIYKTMAEESGVVASQAMLLVGTDDSGLEHPNWRSNLALALYLQEAVGRKHPTLMRPVTLVSQRYNQHLTGGSLILEVGSSGNTLQEALAAIRLFADGAAPALAALAETPEDASAAEGANS